MAMKIRSMYRAQLVLPKSGKLGIPGTLAWLQSDDGLYRIIWRPDVGDVLQVDTEEVTQEENDEHIIEVEGHRWKVYNELPVTAPKVITAVVGPLRVMPQARAGGFVMKTQKGK